MDAGEFDEPNWTPAEARDRERYVLENGEHIERRMIRKAVPPEVLRLWEEPLSPEEFEKRLAQARAELDGPELENLRELISWFQRRYPTALARLRYDRKRRPVTGGR